MSKGHPSLVTKLTNLCDAWIIGSAADPNNKEPRDYDIWIPVNNWRVACNIVGNIKDIKLNTLGGFKVISDGKEVDIWTCEMEVMLKSSFFKFAHHPNSGIYIKREL